MSRTRIVKGKIYGIVEKHLSYYSEAEIIESATINYIENSDATIVHAGNPSPPPAAEINILADAIVHFRPQKNGRVMIMDLTGCELKIPAYLEIKKIF